MDIRKSLYSEQNDEIIDWIKHLMCTNQPALTERLIDRARQEQKSVVIECAPAQAATRRIAGKKGFRTCGSCDGLAVYRLP